MTRYNLGAELANTGQFQEAAAEFSELLRRFPYNELFLNSLGAVRARQGNYEQALEHFRAAIRLNPLDANSYRNAGTACQALGTREGHSPTTWRHCAWRPTRPARVTRSTDSPVCWPGARSHHTTGPEMAIQLAKRATAITQGVGADSLDMLATAYAAAGQYTNAITTGRKALDAAKGQGISELVSKLQIDLLAYEAGRASESNWKQAPLPLAR